MLRGKRQLRSARLFECIGTRIGVPDLVIGLDSGCGNYEQLWGTTSLRGLINGVLTVEVLTEGVHSGDASGVVASSFRVARVLLERIDAADTGIVKHSAFHAQIPPERARRRARRRSARRGDLAQVSLRPRHAADAGRSRGSRPQPHLAAVPRRHRRRRPAAARERRQRAQARTELRAFPSSAADGERRERRAPAQGDPRGRSTLRRARQLQRRALRHRLARPARPRRGLSGLSKRRR